MSGHAQKGLEYLGPVFKRVYDKPTDRMDDKELAKMSRDYAIIIKKQSDGSHLIIGLSRNSTTGKPEYMEINIDKKTSDEALRAFSKMGKERPTGVTAIMRGLYGKFDRYAGIDAEEAKLITRAFLAIRELGPDEARVTYQPKYFKKESKRELPSKIERIDVGKESKETIDNRIAEMKEYKTPDAWIKAMDLSSLSTKTILENLQAASEKVPKYRTGEVKKAIDFYMDAYLTLRQREELENAPTERPTKEVTPVRTGTMLPPEKKKPNEEQQEIIDRVKGYFESMGYGASTEGAGTFKEPSVQKLDTYVIKKMFGDMQKVSAMMKEHKVLGIGERELDRIIKLLEKELGNRK